MKPIYYPLTTLVIAIIAMSYTNAQEIDRRHERSEHRIVDQISRIADLRIEHEAVEDSIDDYRRSISEIERELERISREILENKTARKELRSDLKAEHEFLLSGSERMRVQSREFSVREVGVDARLRLGEFSRLGRVIEELERRHRDLGRQLRRAKRDMESVEREHQELKRLADSLVREIKNPQERVRLERLTRERRDRAIRRDNLRARPTRFELVSRLTERSESRSRFTGLIPFRRDTIQRDIREDLDRLFSRPILSKK